MATTINGRHGEIVVKQVKGPFVKLQAHAQHCDTVEELINYCKKSEKPLAVDLFCGAGGLSLGLKDAGFDVVLGIDSNKDAIETHASQMPGLSVCWDLCDDDVVESVIRLIKKCKIQLVAGGPPCQPFSMAGRSLMRRLVAEGRRSAIDSRRDMWATFLSIVERSLPPAVLMENVPEIALDGGMQILREMVARLEACGYVVHTRVVETWRHGVPQFRERFFLIALLGGKTFAWPQETGQRNTVGNAIDDLPPVNGGDRPAGGAEGWWEYGGPNSTFQERARAGLQKGHEGRIYDHITRPVRDDDRKVFELMDHRTRYDDLPTDLKRYRDDIFKDKYKRLDSNDLSRTITAHMAKDGYWYIHPTQHRTLTVREAARIQTFTDNVRFAGGPSSAFRQIGNAVPPLMAQQLGIAIRAGLGSRARNKGLVSTTKIATSLADWFSTLQDLGSPWFRTGNRWLTIQSEILFDRVKSELVRQAWPIIKRFESPAGTLASASHIEEVAGYLGKPTTPPLILSCAEWLEASPETASDNERLFAIPGIKRQVAALACWVDLNGQSSVIIQTAGLLRVAGRVNDTVVGKSNANTAGRIAISRMVGGEETAREAFLALVEVSRRLCSVQNPKCVECPLAKFCAFGSASLRRRPMLF